MRSTGARVHLCRLSAAPPAWRWCAQAKAEGLPVTCDVSINSLHLTDTDIGYFDSRMRLNAAAAPAARPRRAARRRWPTAPSTRWCPTTRRSTTTPRRCRSPKPSPARPGLELLLALALKWGEESGAGLPRALAVLTSEPARVLGAALGTLQASVGQLVEGGVADLCVFDPAARVDGRRRRAAQPGQAHALRRLRAAGPGALHARRRPGRVRRLGPRLRP